MHKLPRVGVSMESMREEPELAGNYYVGGGASTDETEFFHKIDNELLNRPHTSIVNL